MSEDVCINKVSLSYPGDIPDWSPNSWVWPHGHRAASEAYKSLPQACQSHAPVPPREEPQSGGPLTVSVTGWQTYTTQYGGTCLPQTLTGTTHISYYQYSVLVWYDFIDEILCNIWILKTVNALYKWQ